MTDLPESGSTARPETMVSPSIAFTETAAPPAVPAFDVAKYRDLIAACDLTEEQQRAMLETLWSIMHSFVELGFQYDVCAAVFQDHENLAEQTTQQLESSLKSTFAETSNSGREKGPT